MRKICSLFILNFLLGCSLAAAQNLISVASLSEYCQQRSVTPFYAKPHYERFLEKIFLTAAQKIIIDELKVSLYELANKASAWESLLSKIQSDIKNECKVSGQLFSPNQFYTHLLSPYYQQGRSNLLQHDQLLKGLAPELVQTLHRTNVSLGRQIFRDMCSWNGLVSDSALIDQYLNDPAIGLKVLKYLATTTRPIFCGDEGCRFVERREWEALLPRPQERRSIAEDLQDYWCGFHFVKRYGTSPGMRWKVTLAGDLLLNHHDPFYLHALGIPLNKQWSEKVQNSLGPWAKQQLESMMLRTPWEEELRVYIENQDQISYDSKEGATIIVEYGEFDRNYQSYDKVTLRDSMILNRPLLEWALSWKYRDQAAVVRTLAINIKQQLVKLEAQHHYLNYASNLHTELAEWILVRLEQMLGRQQIKDHPEIMQVRIPIHFKTGIMALKLVHDRRL